MRYKDIEKVFHVHAPSIPHGVLVGAGSLEPFCSISDNQYFFLKFVKQVG
jgi:hypothetical protein